MSASAKRVAVLAIIIGNQDEPVFLKDLRPGAPNGDENALNNSEEYLYNFVIHSSLDMVAEKQWQTTSSFLGVVETFREYSVAAWVSASEAKFLLLYRGFSDTAVRNFLKAVSSLWVRVALNPLQERNAIIVSPGFDNRVLLLATRYLA